MQLFLGLFKAVFDKYVIDPVLGIEQLADRFVMVERVDYISAILGHINAHIPLSRQQLGGRINKICGENLADEAVGISLVKGLETVAE